MGTMPLYGMQRYWNMWPSMMETALFTRSGTLLRTEDMELHCSMAAPIEMFSHKGKCSVKGKTGPERRSLSTLDRSLKLIFR